MYELLRRNRWLRVGAPAAALILSLAIFYVRTARQPQYRPADFAAYYTPARAWLAGENPYDLNTMHAKWVAAGGRTKIMADYDGKPADWFMPVIGIPQEFPLMAPLAMLRAPTATVIWYALMAALLIAQSAALASMIKSKLWRPAGMIVLACSLLLAPVHEIFGYGQPSGPVIAMIVLSIWAMTNHREVVAGVLLALATAFKPQLAGPFVLYYIMLRRWRLAGAFAIVFALLSIAAIAPMAARGTPWFATWRANMIEASAPDGVNSTLPENVGRHAMLQLQLILHGFMHAEMPVELMAAAITAGLAAMFAWCYARCAAAGKRDELLAISAVCVLALLPVYHRFYDAALIVVPLAWAVRHLRDRPAIAWPVLAFALSFVLPMPVVLRGAQVIGIDPKTATGWMWDGVVEPWRTWVLLAGLVCIFRAMARRHERARSFARDQEPEPVMAATSSARRGSRVRAMVPASPS